MFSKPVERFSQADCVTPWTHITVACCLFLFAWCCCGIFFVSIPWNASICTGPFMWSQHDNTQNNQVQLQPLPCRYPGPPETNLPCFAFKEQHGLVRFKTSRMGSRSGHHYGNPTAQRQKYQGALEKLGEGCVAPWYNHAFTITQCYSTRYCFWELTQQSKSPVTTGILAHIRESEEQLPLSTDSMGR